METLGLAHCVRPLCHSWRHWALHTVCVAERLHSLKNACGGLSELQNLGGSFRVPNLVVIQHNEFFLYNYQQDTFRTYFSQNYNIVTLFHGLWCAETFSETIGVLLFRQFAARFGFRGRKNSTCQPSVHYHGKKVIHCSYASNHHEEISI